jgi:hypothetical protein
MNYDSRKNMPAIHGDGFSDVDDEGNGSLIENPPKVKFGNDAKWRRGDEVIPSSRIFHVINIRRVVQHWVNQLPTNKSRVLEPGEKWPDIEELNAAAPPEEWRDHFGKRIGPWQKTYMAYLFDEKTTEVFTYPTTTAGGFRAIHELRKATERAQLVCGQEVYPLITLGDAAFPTSFGLRRRPNFNILGYQPLGPRQASPAQIEHRDERHGDGHHDRGEGVKHANRGKGEPSGHRIKSAEPGFEDEIPW